jgi:hypothetical protein
MLEGLDTIDWSRYHHAYGAATDVPKLLRALADPGGAKDIAVRKGGDVVDAVTGQLWGNVFHQGSVWGVSAKTIPFFIEIFEETEAKKVRRFVVDYLHHLALGYPSDLFPRRFDIEGLEAAAQKVVDAKLLQSVIDGDAFGAPPDGVDPAVMNEVGAVWMRDCYRGVEEVIPRLLPSLEDVDDGLVQRLVALLASFPRRRPVSALRCGSW